MKEPIKGMYLVSKRSLLKEVYLDKKIANRMLKKISVRPLYL